MRFPSVGAGLLVFAIAARASAQDGREYKTVLRDTSIHPLVWGYDFRTGAILRNGAVVRHRYEVVTKVWPGTPAEEAGIKPGDEILSISGFDLATQHDSAVRRLANVPVPRCWLKANSISRGFERSFVAPARARYASRPARGARRKMGADRAPRASR